MKEVKIKFKQGMTEFVPVPVINKKNGEVYLFLGYAADVTNGGEGSPNFRAVYLSQKDGFLYVRDEFEFREKFEEANPVEKVSGFDVGPFPINLEDLDQGPRCTWMNFTDSFLMTSADAREKSAREMIINGVMTASGIFYDDPSIILDVELLEEKRGAMHFRITKRKNPEVCHS